MTWLTNDERDLIHNLRVWRNTNVPTEL